MTYTKLITIVSLTILFMICLIIAAAPPAAAKKQPRILVEGVPMRGTANGMFFDEYDRLWVANLLGRSISVLDPDSGEVLEQLGPAEGVFFPDDLTFSPVDGYLFWTDPFIGAVGRINPEGGIPTIAPVFPGVNPITFSDDGRLFFAQCFAPPEPSIFEADPITLLPINTIFTDVTIGAANGMDYWEEFLYFPRWFEGRVVKMPVDGGDLIDVTTDWGVPAAVKFDSQGRLHAVNNGNGEVVRINLATGERELLAQLPIGLDSLAFDSDDRLFVSSSADGFVVEIDPDGSVRTVSPGGMTVAGGVAVIGKTLYVNEPLTIRGFNRHSGRQVSVTRSVGFIGPISTLPFSMEADGDHLIIMSWAFGDLVIWDPETESEVLSTLFAGPIDVQRFQGDLIVSEPFLGQVVRASGPNLEIRETLATLAFPTGLAATDGDLYVSDSVLGMVFQIVRGGELLTTPSPIATGLANPEGMAVRCGGNRLVIVEAGTDSLKEVHLNSGEIRTIASNLGFYDPLPGMPPFDVFLNNVTIDNTGAMYINADEANVIYKFRLECGQGRQ
jgi:sugar lactone lactonase YvrE